MQMEEKSLLDVVSELFEGESLLFNPVLGVEIVERVTSEAVRIEFVDKVDYDTLLEYNMKATRLAERYRKKKYQSIISRLDPNY